MQINFYDKWQCRWSESHRHLERVILRSHVHLGLIFPRWHRSSLEGTWLDQRSRIIRTRHLTQLASGSFLIPYGSNSCYWKTEIIDQHGGKKKKTSDQWVLHLNSYFHHLPSNSVRQSPKFPPYNENVCIYSQDLCWLEIKPLAKCQRLRHYTNGSQRRFPKCWPKRRPQKRSPPPHPFEVMFRQACGGPRSSMDQQVLSLHCSSPGSVD